MGSRRSRSCGGAGAGRARRRAARGQAYEICRELRETRGQRLPIIFVSAHRTQAADEVAGLLLGADEYFAKPITAELFVAGRGG